MKVKITSCHGNKYCWYKDKIGEIFDVGEDDGSLHFKVKNSSYSLIQTRDCVVLSPKEECLYKIEQKEIELQALKDELKEFDKKYFILYKFPNMNGWRVSDGMYRSIEEFKNSLNPVSFSIDECTARLIEE